MVKEKEEETILNLMVDKFSLEMKNKLLKKSKEGFSGWETLEPWELMDRLKEHIGKHDMVDVANFAAMIWHGKQKNKNSERDKLKSEIENLEMSISNAKVLVEKYRKRICSLEGSIDNCNGRLAEWSTELFVKKHERDRNEIK